MGVPWIKAQVWCWTPLKGGSIESPEISGSGKTSTITLVSLSSTTCALESSNSWSNRALEIKLIACLAISSGILWSTARRKFTASWNCSMSMLAFGFGRSSSGSSDAAFLRSGWARPNLTHFIHSVLLPSWREICMWPAGNDDDPREWSPVSDLGCRFFDQWCGWAEPEKAVRGLEWGAAERRAAGWCEWKWVLSQVECWWTVDWAWSGFLYDQEDWSLLVGVFHLPQSSQSCHCDGSCWRCPRWW